MDARRSNLVLFTVFGVCAGLLVYGCERWGGDQGLKGALLGLFATTFNTLALGAVVWLFGHSFRQGSPPRLGASLAVIAFFIKLPLFIAFGILAQRIGGAAPACFLLGLALVYFALIGWVLARR